MILRALFTIFFLVITFPLWCFYIGNPSSPALFTKSVLQTSENWWQLHTGYVYDKMYKGRFKERVVTEDSDPTFATSDTQAALLSLNLFNHWEIYGVVGGTKMTFDKQIYSHRRTSWSTGTKILIYRLNNLYFGLDGKYFYTDQKPDYILSDGDVYTLITPLTMRYQEFQGSFGIAYNDYRLFSPYLGFTYLFSQIDPYPKTVILKEPKTDDIIIFDLKESDGKKTWGFYLGTTIVTTGQININLEARFFDQNAFNVSGAFRF